MEEMKLSMHEILFLKKVYFDNFYSNNFDLHRFISSASPFEIMMFDYLLENNIIVNVVVQEKINKQINSRHSIEITKKGLEVLSKYKNVFRISKFLESIGHEKNYIHNSMIVQNSDIFYNNTKR